MEVVKVWVLQRHVAVRVIVSDDGDDDDGSSWLAPASSFSFPLGILYFVILV